MRKFRVLFVYLSPTSFVRDDLETLAERVELVPFHFDVDRARTVQGLAAQWAAQRKWLKRELAGADLVYGWFADYHMVLPITYARRQAKPVVVALGGYDCLSLPELGYGVFSSPWRAPLARYVLRRASMLLPVSETLWCSENRFSAWPASKRFGLCVHVPGVRTPHRELPTGYLPERWPAGPAQRAPSVASVGLIDSEQTLRRKGIDLVLAVASQLPEISFRVIGVSDAMKEWIRSHLTVASNVSIEGPVPRDELARVYQATSVYLQLSRAEGMPNVLCEAMLCGCVPVVSRVFGNPAGAGDAGFVVDEPTPEAMAGAIRAALAADVSCRERARSHVMARFHRSRRADGLQEVFRTLVAEA
jgi:glycosyltransferase involved in cell wall biosynthesis